MKSFILFLCCLYALQSLGQDSSFRETPVQLKITTGILKGTLTEPVSKKKKYPVILMIAGSGPTDRNGNNPTMKNDAFRQLAHQLANAGIATLRYDKRGIAESANAGIEEKNMRIDSFIVDAGKWIDTLRSIKRFSSIIVAGHSEGSLIGLKIASKADKYISMAGAGRPADIVIREQLASQPKPVMEHSYGIMDTLKMGLKPTVVNPLVLSLFRPSIQDYLISWFSIDPAKEIAGLKIPILIIQGTNDIQVAVKDAELLHAANPSSKLLLITDMNHVFRKVQSSRNANIATYYKTDPPIEKELVEAIVGFVKR